MSDILLKIPTYGATLASGIQEERLFETKAGRLGLSTGWFLYDHFDDNDHTSYTKRYGNSWSGSLTESGTLLTITSGGVSNFEWAMVYKTITPAPVNEKIRGRVRVSANPQTGGVSIRCQSSGGDDAYVAGFAPSGKFSIYKGTIGHLIYTTATYSLNTWYWAEISYVSGTIYASFYTDAGVLIESISWADSTFAGELKGIHLVQYLTTAVAMDTDWLESNIFSTSSPIATLMKIGAGVGTKFKPLGSGLWIPENIDTIGTPQAPKYQYAKLAGYNDTPAYNGTWLTQAQLRTAIGERTGTIEALMLQAQFPSNGTVNCSIDDGFIPAEMLRGGASIIGGTIVRGRI